MLSALHTLAVVTPLFHEGRLRNDEIRSKATFYCGDSAFGVLVLAAVNIAADSSPPATPEKRSRG